MAEGTLCQPSPMMFSGDVAGNWKKFRQRFEIYLQASGKSNKPEKLKTSVLLHVIGEEGLEVYNTFQFDAPDGDNDPSMTLQTVIDKFEEYCNPKRNVTLERFYFNQCTQVSDETVDHFVTRVKKLSQNCAYGDLKDSLIMDRIICGLYDNTTRERLLRTVNLDLETCINICRAAESVKIQSQQLSTASTSNAHAHSNKGQ
jgi:hypothetical protein